MYNNIIHIALPGVFILIQISVSDPFPNSFFAWILMECKQILLFSLHGTVTHFLVTGRNLDLGGGAKGLKLLLDVKGEIQRH